MSESYQHFYNQQQSHISNYSGVFDQDAIYEKFDFVYNTGDGLFYYAKKDNVRGGGATIEGANRFSLYPDENEFVKVDGRPTNSIIDEYNQLDTISNTFKVGQTIDLQGSENGSDGEYTIQGINTNYDVRIKSDLNLTQILGGNEADPDSELNYFTNSWFFDSDYAGSDNIFKNNFYWYGRNFARWVDSFESVYSQWQNYQSTNGVSHPQFPANLDKEGFGRFLYNSDPSSSLTTPLPIDDIQIDHESLGKVQLSTLHGSSREICFYLSQVNTLDDSNPIWFYTNDSLARRGLAFMVSEGNSDFGELGWTFWQRYPGASSQVSKLESESIGVYNFSESKWYKITNTLQSDNKPRLVYETDESKVPEVNLPENPTVSAPTSTEDYRAKILIQGINDSTYIRSYEHKSSNELYITIVDSFPSDSPDAWVSDLFFFDADYGSTASYKVENNTIDYSNGYTYRSPKSINALTFEAKLNFKNRTNKEANAIVHFIENHQGQLEKDASSDFLKYSQGISGFRWDGGSTFHPYDSLNSQTTRFICGGVDHRMNFENSNDISLTLRNFNTSILNKSEGLFVRRADEYNESEYYEYNDVIFSTGNHKYYYNISDFPIANTPPVEQYRDDDNLIKFRDINTNTWSREFIWKPSIGLDVNQKFNLSEISATNGYSQFYKDGINESLLELNLSFKSRDDSEAYAILHFLEDHLGFIPFIYSPPAPYNRKLNFVCESWNHTYVYKNSHTITAVFKQVPFNFSSEKIDNRFNDSPVDDPELNFSSPVTFSIGNDASSRNRDHRRRIFFENKGLSPITLSSITIDEHEELLFEILGQEEDEVPLIVQNDLTSEDYIIQLPSSPDLPFGLNEKYIKLSKFFTNGDEGGISFKTLIDNGDGTFSDEKVGANRVNHFRQRNDGLITSSFLGGSSYADYIIGLEFFKKNKVSILEAEQRGYVDVVYRSQEFIINIIDENENNIINENGDFLIALRAANFYTNSFNVVYNNGSVENLQGLITINI
ncbi:MAG: hypothetical protein EBY39_01600 [Flavobacteriia bacterium]|nr:hypothetical protein [Flavobacteriia bacterium]